MEKAQRLKGMKLFEALTGENLGRWADKFRRELHPQGMTVIREGDRATRFYIIDRGKVRVYTRVRGRELPLAYFFPDDYFGETGLLTGEPRNASVETLSEVELLVLDKLDFDQLMVEFPDVHDRLRKISRRREEAGRTRFPWLQSDEVTLFFSTKHWIAFLRALRLTFALGLLSVLSSAVYLSSIGAQLSDLLLFFLMLLSGTLLGLTVFSGVYHFFDWRNDYYVITNLRVLHVERVLLLREERDEAPIERVQDVQVRQGALANLLDFGDVLIQTAAATERIVFANVSHPDYVRDALFSPMRNRISQSREKERESIQHELKRILNVIETASEEEKADAKELPGQPAPQEAEQRTDATADASDALRQRWKALRDRFTFETCIRSEDGKTITWRKNGWLLFWVSLPPLFVSILVLVGIILLVRGDILSLPFGSSLLLLLLSVSVFWWFYAYWDWQNDIYEISGNRLIDLKRRPLGLQEIRRETTLDRVENISLSIPGPIAQLLNHGTVVIETAGETGAFRFEQVHNPRGVHEEIFKRLNDFEREQREQQQREHREEMAMWFEAYEDLKRQQAAENLPGEG